ncbi:MAG: hypothetical protein OYI31_08790 [Chloroflexota bacterium]|nr:hypothetical protein [Chloroflexota bacterium]MDE2940733.1 hypothetical protein [Chloroflexota bacterium]MDE3268528.1 hypothetical protein [Chloroflexota bacterium]
MPDKDENQFAAIDLPVALYLNQRLTFDVLAALKGGFSRLETVQTTSSGGTTTEVSGGAQLGISNIFALLRVQFGGRGSRQAEQLHTDSTTSEIIHTPASLFASARRDLYERGLVKEVSSSGELDAIQPGDFVEFRAALRRNPFVEFLSAFTEIVPLMEVFGEQVETKSSGRQRKQGRSANSEMLKQVKALLTLVTAKGSQDLIAEVGSVRFVLTTEQDYFIDPTMNDVIDGTFHVFGKVSRVIANDSEGTISLMRKTALGRFGTVVNQLGTAMTAVEGLGFEGSLETEINGPAIQVIPISIFS